MSVIQIHKPEPISKEDWAYYLSFNPGDYVRLTVDALKTENRFFVDERFQKLIYTYAFDPSERGHSTKYLLPGQPTLFRARIYKRDDAHERLNAPEQYGLFQGYDEAGSFVPPEGIYTDEGGLIHQILDISILRQMLRQAYWKSAPAPEKSLVSHELNFVNPPKCLIFQIAGHLCGVNRKQLSGFAFFTLL